MLELATCEALASIQRWWCMTSIDSFSDNRIFWRLKVCQAVDGSNQRCDHLPAKSLNQTPTHESWFASDFFRSSTLVVPSFATSHFQRIITFCTRRDRCMFPPVNYLITQTLPSLRLQVMWRHSELRPDLRSQKVLFKEWHATSSLRIVS